jgi:twinfilin-like protein
MARANLNVSSQLQSIFQSAQEASSTVRAIKAAISNEEIVFSSNLQITGTAQADFNTLLPTILSGTEAAMVLFRLGDTSTDKNHKWLLIAWVPDGCRVRDKMLYSSSREDLKKSLGFGQFTADYAASLTTDIKWDAYLESIAKVNKEDVLTEKERTLKEEDAMVHTERAALGSKSTAMGVVPFTLGQGVQDAFRNFNAGKCNWLEMSVVSEVIRLEASKTLAITDNLESNVNAESPR